MLIVMVVVIGFCVFASPTSVRKFFALIVHVTIATKIVGPIVIRVPLIKPTFVVVFRLVSTMVVVIDVVSGAFPTTVRELLTFIIPVTVGILRRSVAVFIPCVIPASIRAQSVFFIVAVIVSLGPNIALMLFVVVVVMVVVVIVVRVPSHPELVPREVAIAVRVEF